MQLRRKPHHRPARLFAAGVAASALVVVSVPAAASGSGSGTVRLAHEIPTWTAGARDLGPLASNRSMQVGITIARPNPAGEAAFSAALYNPHSARYHHFPSVATWDARFGVPISRYSAVRRYAIRDGLRVIRTDGSHDTLLLSGSAAQVEQTFAVHIHAYSLHGKSLFANTDAPAVPAGLGISAVTSLASDPGLRYANAAPSNNAGSDAPATFTPALTTTTRHKHGKQTASGYPAQDGCDSVPGECVGILQPEALWDVYHAPAYKKSGGQGEQMAVIGEGATTPTIKDLRLFEATHKLPRMRIRVVSVGDNFKDTEGTDEWDLDTQSSTAMAPLARRETLYFGKSLDDASLDGALSAWVDDAHGARQANMSIGECELIGRAADNPFIVATEATLSKAVALGKTLFNSTGDTGGSCPVGPVAVNGVTNDGAPSAEYPSTSPNVVSVGGTELFTNGTLPTKRLNEFAWAYSGGGSSYVFAAPTWQKSLPTTYLSSCPAAAGGVQVTTQCRDVPDIAALSGDALVGLALGGNNGNGFSTVGNGSFDESGGGTSLSSPLEMGLWTRVQAASPKTNGHYRGLGFATPLFYKLALNPKTDAKAFFDVGGSSHSMPATNGQEATLPRSAADPTGYDEITGLGVPEIKQVMKLLDHRITPTHPRKQLKANEHFAACPVPGGVLTDPKGDANNEPVGSGTTPVSYPGYDITRATITYQRKPKTITFTTHIDQLAQATGAIVVRSLFGFAYVGYYADAERQANGSTSFAIRTGDSVRPTTLTVPHLSGSFDNATDTVTFVLPVKAFNKALHPRFPMGPGRVLAPFGTRSRVGTGSASVIADLANEADGCGYTIPGKVHHQ